MRRYIFCFFILTLQISCAASSIRRVFAKNPVFTGETLEVNLHIDLTDLPGGMIITETLPEGVNFLQSCWKGKDFQPRKQDNELKWLFSAPGVKPATGILTYTLLIDETKPTRLRFYGTFEPSSSEVQTIAGEWQISANIPELDKPQFIPADGTVFEEELLINIHSTASLETEIYFCLGDRRYWQNWQFYDGPFYIRHSEQISAELWHEPSQSSSEAKAEYWRRCTCKLEWHQGWNLLGVPIILSTHEWEKIKAESLFFTYSGTMSAFWLFASQAAELSLTGLEPIQRGLPALATNRWQLVTPLGLEVLHAPHGLFYEWQQHAFRRTRELMPGKAYYVRVAE